MGCLRLKYTPVRLHCLQRLVSNHVLQSNQKLEVNTMFYVVLGLTWAIGVVTGALFILIWDMIK